MGALGRRPRGSTVIRVRALPAGVPIDSGVLGAVERSVCMTERQASAYERFQWYRHQRNPDDPGLTVGYVYALTGDVDTDRLGDALREVVSTVFPRLLDYFTEVG